MSISGPVHTEVQMCYGKDRLCSNMWLFGGMADSGRHRIYSVVVCWLGLQATWHGLFFNTRQWQLFEYSSETRLLELLGSVISPLDFLCQC